MSTLVVARMLLMQLILIILTYSNVGEYVICQTGNTIDLVVLIQKLIKLYLGLKILHILIHVFVVMILTITLQ